jgi:hypothetical protein
MGLETVTDIDDLDISNPLGTDPRSQGDDHIRNIKKALKTDFPSITGAMTATQAELNVLDGVTAGTVTASKGVVVDATSKVDVWNVDNLTIDGNTLTANTGAINITPAAGSAIVLDATINVDAGVVTGATSITSTTFSGDLTGAVTGNADTATSATTAGTVTTAASITLLSKVTLGQERFDSSTGTITGGVVVADNININGNTIISTDTAGNINVTPDTTGDLILDGVKWPQADGTANQILTTDGAAQAAWGSPVTTTALTTHGDILFRNASALARLGAGTNGQFLTSGGAGADVSWSTQAAADLSPVQTNIALLGFLRSTDHATSVLNMQNGFIDQFEDQTLMALMMINSFPMTLCDSADSLITTWAALGVADGKTFLFSTIVKFNADGTEVKLINGSNARCSIKRNTSNEIEVILLTSADSALGTVRSTSTFTASDGATHLAVAVDLANTRIHILKNGVLETNQVDATITDGTIDLDDTNCWILDGAQLAGELGQFYFNTSTLDFTVSADIAKVYDVAGGRYVDYGATGANVTGGQPQIYLNNEYTTWQNNLGSGGNFTENGALAAADLILP